MPKKTIEEHVEGFGIDRLKRTPHGYKGCCFINPNHKDNSPSMHINLDKGHVKCFSCGAYRSVFTFLTDNGVPFDEAIDFLFMGFTHEKRENREIQDYVLGRKIPKSMIDRGFEVATLQNFKVGYDEKEGHTTFPLYYNGKLYGIIYRAYPKEFWASEGFVKDNFIYNYEPTKERVYVEGQTDTMMVWQNGTKNVSSCLQALPSEGQIELMSQHKHIIIATDNDAAGFKGAFAIHHHLGRYCDISVVPYKGKDPGACSKAEWSRGMSNLRTFPEFEIAMIKNNRELYDKIVSEVRKQY